MTPSVERGAHVPGLDGLRMIAVVAVIVYHLDAPWLPGGFLGVDVFFVISGYLITSQLWAGAADRGHVDLTGFWLARARRLLPALAAMLLATSLAQTLLDRPGLRAYLGDLGAAATYTSNWWYVLHERSYFDAIGRPPALQHLWSLAVEEQFYLAWPLIVAGTLLLTSRSARRRTLLAVCGVGAVASALVMGLGSWRTGAPLDADASRFYFGTDSHATGLLVGAALAVCRDGAGFGAARPALAPARPWLTALGAFTLLGIVAVFVRVDAFSTALYRVGFALVALATTLVVAVATRPGPLARLLEHSLATAIGRRSYGLYLWHWPVFVFTRPRLDVPLHGAADVALRLGLLAAVSEASYRFVEQPVRRAGLRRTWRELPGLYARPAVLMAASSALLVPITIATSTPTAAEVSAAARLARLAEGARHPQPSASASRRHTISRAHTRNLTLAVYGDSFAIGVEPDLLRSFASVEVHAAIGEQPWTMVDQLAAEATTISADVVLIHIGNNGIVDRARLEGAIARIPATTSVVVAVPRVPRSWGAPNVTALRRLAHETPRVHLLDWYAATDGRPDFVVADGVHPTSAGGRAYVRLLQEVLARPAT